MFATARLKHWGSSLGIVVPRDIITHEHLKEGEEIIIEIKKKRSVREAFGALKTWRINAQRMKDQLREEW